jgi:hypothetical protein
VLQDFMSKATNKSFGTMMADVQRAYKMSD